MAMMVHCNGSLGSSSNTISDVGIEADDCLDLSNKNIVYDELADRVSLGIAGLGFQQKSQPLSSYASELKKGYKSINLSNNHLSDSGVIELAELLKDEACLEHLSIAHNNAGGEALRTLLLKTLLLGNIKSIDVRGNLGASLVCMNRLRTQIKEQLGEDMQCLLEKVIWEPPSEDTRIMP